MKMHLSRIYLCTITSTNSPSKLHFYFEGKIENTFSTSFFKKKKSQKPIKGNICCKELQIEKDYFDVIYKNKVRLLFDNSVSELNYKLLHNC